MQLQSVQCTYANLIVQFKKQTKIVHTQLNAKLLVIDQKLTMWTNLKYTMTYNRSSILYKSDWKSFRIELFVTFHNIQALIKRAVHWITWVNSYADIYQLRTTVMPVCELCGYFQLPTTMMPICELCGYLSITTTTVMPICELCGWSSN